MTIKNYTTAVPAKGELSYATILAPIDFAVCSGVYAELLLESVSATREKCCRVAYPSAGRVRFLGEGGAHDV